MRLHLIHDEDGRIVSFVPPGAELPGPPAADQHISEVEAPDLDANDLTLNLLQRQYRIDLSDDPPRLVSLQVSGTPRSGAGRPLDRFSTMPPDLPEMGHDEHQRHSRR
jgi:hypothetical protein